MDGNNPRGDGTPLDAVASLSSLADNTFNLSLLIKQIQARVGVVPFVGAGMSVPFGFPAWRPFLESQSPDETVRQQIVRLLDHGQYEEAAELLLDTRGENAFQEVLKSTFGAQRLPRPLPAAAIMQLPRLCSGPVLTTNFDPVLEKVFENANRPFEDRLLGMNVKAIREAFAHGRRVLIKLHGDADNASSRVLTRSDYERAYDDREPLRAVLQFTMQACSLVFLGCSLGSDRTVRVMETLAEGLRKQKAEDLLKHYAIVERPRDDAEFAERHDRLKHLGIFPIWYPTGQHGMIAELLAYLAAEAGHDLVCGAVPAEPPHYLLRSAELAELRAMLLAGNGRSVAITGQGHALGVQGMGGVGKTVLAAALTRDAAVQKAYPDGIFWLTVSAQPNFLSLLTELACSLSDCDELLTSATVAQTKLREALAGRRALLILDDVWHVDHAAALNVISAPGRLLVTTRNRAILEGLDAEEFCVDVLTPEAALRMLANWTHEPNPARLPAVAADVARECGYLPLALAMIGAMVKRPTAWADALELLRGRDLEEFRRAFPDYPYPDLLRAIAVGVGELPADDRERYLDLAVFPEDQAIPEGPIQTLWGLTPAKARACMDRLVTRSLATRRETDGRGALLLHDLQWDYVRKVRENRLPGLHTRLLDGYHTRCPAGWSTGPDDGYYFEFLPFHMFEAKQSDELRALFWSLEWLLAKLRATDVAAIIADLRDYAEPGPLQVLQEAIGLSALALLNDPQQLPSQLVGRLALHEDGRLSQLVDDARAYEGSSWLCPATQSLQAPGGALLMTLQAHAAEVNALAVTPDSQRLISASRDRTLNIWDIATGKHVRTLIGHTAAVCDAAVTPDAKFIVSGSWDKTLKVWESETGRELFTLRGHEAALAVAALPGGLSAVSVDTFGVLKFWDLGTGKESRTIDAHHSSAVSVAVSPDGHFVLTSTGNELKVWEAGTGRQIYDLSRPYHSGYTLASRAVAVTPDSRRAIAVHWDRCLRVWDLETGSEVGCMKGESRLVGVVLMPDGSAAISAEWDGLAKLELWKVDAAERVGTIGSHLGVSALAVTPDGRQLVSGSRDGSVRIWDLTKRSTSTGPSLEWERGAIAITPDSRHVVCGVGDGALRVWNLEDGSEVRALQGHSSRITALALTSEGEQVISGSTDQTARIWDLATGLELIAFRGHSGPVTAVAVTSDNHYVVTASDDHTVRIWNANSGDVLRTLIHSGAVTFVHLLPDDQQIISASSDSRGLVEFRIWNLASGRQLARFGGGVMGDVAMAAEGRLVMLSHRPNVARDEEYGGVEFWDVETRQRFSPVPAREGHSPMYPFAFVPHVRRCISTHYSDEWYWRCNDLRQRAFKVHALKLWDQQTGEIVATLQGHTGAVTSIAVGLDGSIAASSSVDQSVRVWRSDTGELLATFTGDSPIRQCLIAPDGVSMVASDFTGRLHFLCFREAAIDRLACIH